MKCAEASYFSWTLVIRSRSWEKSGAWFAGVHRFAYYLHSNQLNGASCKCWIIFFWFSNRCRLRRFSSCNHSYSQTLAIYSLLYFAGTIRAMGSSRNWTVVSWTVADSRTDIKLFWSCFEIVLVQLYWVFFRLRAFPFDWKCRNPLLKLAFLTMCTTVKPRHGTRKDDSWARWDRQRSKLIDSKTLFRVFFVRLLCF